MLTSDIRSVLGRPVQVLAFTLGATLLSAGLARAETIQVWSGYPEMAPYYEHVAAGMKSTHPDLTFQVTAVPLREHEKRVALALASGASQMLIVELDAATAKRYLDNDLLTKAPDDVSAFVGDPKNFGKFFIEGASRDGAVYGVPLFRDVSALYYNTDMLKEAGLDSPPSTIDAYTDYATKLTKRDGKGNPTVSGWSLRLSGGGQGIAEKFWNILFQHGGTLLTQTADGKWKAGYADEAGRKTLKQYLSNIYKEKTVTADMPADAEAFERGQTAMFIRESWVIGDIASKAPDLKYASAPLPKGSMVLSTNLFVKAGEGDPKAAWDFAIAANAPENLTWLLDNIGWLPSRSGVDYSQVIKAKPAFQAFLDYPPDYEFFTIPAIGPTGEILSNLAQSLTQAFGDPSLVDNDAAIDEYLKQAAARTDAILEREGLLGK